MINPFYIPRRLRAVLINPVSTEHERVILKNGRSVPPRDFDKKAHHAAVTRDFEKSLTYGAEEADEMKKA